jgi:hypothetical protein
LKAIVSSCHSTLLAANPIIAREFERLPTLL